MTIVIVLLVLAAVVTVLSVGRVGIRLRRLGPGWERDDLLTSLWSIGGSTCIVASIAMGVFFPFSAPRLALQVFVLGTGVGLGVTSSIKTKRRLATRQDALLNAAASGQTMADRLEALEVRRSGQRAIPLRIQAALTGTKLFIAGTALSTLSVVRDGAMLLIFGTIAGLNIAWAAWDAISFMRKKAARNRIDREIATLLGAGDQRVIERPTRSGGD